VEAFRQLSSDGILNAVCGFFITQDKRVLEKRVELKPMLPPSLAIVTLEEFFEILDEYEAKDTAGRRR
jgi:hypothetical protein